MATADYVFFSAPISVRIELVSPDTQALFQQWRSPCVGYDPCGNGHYLIGLGSAPARFWRTGGISSTNANVRINREDLANLPTFQSNKELGRKPGKRVA